MTEEQILKRREYQRQWQQDHKDKANANAKKYRDNNKNKTYISRIKSYFKQLTHEEQQTLLNDLNSLL